MVVGHTVRAEGISSVCDRQAWRVDVGLASRESPAGAAGAAQVLEVEGGRVRVLSLHAERMPRWQTETSGPVLLEDRVHN